MEREIKFRGKRIIDNGEWVKGFYYEVEELHFIIPDSAILNSVTQSFAKDDFLQGFVEVIPETVGQFTGRKDKNDKDIYEGDICSLISPIQRQDLSPAMVIWSDEGLYWLLKGKLPLLLHRAIDIEVIGNRFDKPELLGSVEA